MDAEDSIRRLVASWMSEAAAEPDHDGPTAPPPGTGLAVPAATAGEVISVARRLATEGLSADGLPAPDPGLRLVAEALVLDEHPSADAWAPADRATALDWITLLIHRFGEDGVQRLVAELA